MTYNDWRDELKDNLLSVSDSERKRVLDYYAEAYADRREAGFSEREIINEFGAPYDAAQRILHENYDGLNVNGEKESVNAANNKQDSGSASEGKVNTTATQSRAEKTKKREDYTWLFVLLCIVFAGPIFGAVMSLVGITIGICAAPFGLLASGLGSITVGIIGLFSDAASGFVAIGVGLLLTGISVILFPLLIKLIKLMWKLFRKFFDWIKSLFSGKESA